MERGGFVKLYFELLKALSKKYIFKKNTGTVIKVFCENMGVVYIKLAQILATQNFGNIFTEDDRRSLAAICDNCRPISFDRIKSIIESEYSQSIEEIFTSIEVVPLGSASISQVHKAVLKDGRVVAVKVKRKDITDSIESDVNKIRRLMNRYGKLFGLKNILVSNKALDLYLKWIYEETDFDHEKENIKTYKVFADSVNGQVRGAKSMQVPLVHEELCTTNIIVMDYVDSRTINQLELNKQNKKKISEAFNSYLQLSFYALLSGEKVVFHGDPHGGNIYIDNSGNIGFLDMGLLFKLSNEDARLTRELFFAAYTGDYKKLCDFLIPYGNFDYKSKEQFEKETILYCERIKSLPASAYFTELMTVCLQYGVSPPDFLFCMAKTFVCVDGTGKFSYNKTKGTQLLKEQVIEFYIRRSIKDSFGLAVRGLSLAPKLLESTFKYGLVKGLAKEVSVIGSMKSDLEQTLGDYQEILGFLTAPPPPCPHPIYAI